MPLLLPVYAGFLRQCISLPKVLSSQLPDLPLLSELKVHFSKVACCLTHFSLMHFQLSLEPPVSDFSSSLYCFHRYSFSW